MGLRESMTAAARSAIVVRCLRRGLQPFTDVDGTLAVPSPVTTADNWTRSSSTVAALRAAGDTTGAAFDRSVVGRVTGWVLTIARSSYAYRWLTTEPDPDVVVIDLEETLVLGPLLSTIDRVVETFLASRRGSRLYRTADRTIEYVEDTPVRALGIGLLSAIVANGLATVAAGSVTTAELSVHIGLALLAILGLRVDTSMDEVRKSRSVQLLVALLEPPEPPDRTGTTSGDQGGEDRSSVSDGEDPPGST